MTRLFLWTLLILSTAVFASDPEPLQREITLMATSLHLTLYDHDHERAMKQSEVWIRIVEKTEQQWSNWRETSEISKLNRQPVTIPFQLSEELCKTIPLLQTYTTQTDGSFDPGIGQLLRIWGHYAQPRIPSKQEIDHAIHASGISKMLFDIHNCTAVRTSDVHMDAGAFGKGLALEEILKNAQANNSAPFLADFGGQLLTSGKFLEAELAHPENRNQRSGIRVRFQSGSLSTSGNSERDRFADGKRIGHILDPHTGEPAPFIGSVTVWHQSPLAADILSTALYVMGPENGLIWANKNQIAACYLSMQSGKLEVTTSSAFAKLLY